MGCIVRTYFRGGLVSIRTRSVPSKFYKKYVPNAEGTHPVGEGACRKKSTYPSDAIVWAASCERTFEVGS